MNNITARRHGKESNGHNVKLQHPTATQELWPLRESMYLRETLQSVLNEWYGGPSAPARQPAFRGFPVQNWDNQEHGAWFPPVNVRETNDEVVLECYLPGVTRGDIEVEVKNGTTLIIRGERKPQRTEIDQQSYLRKEMWFQAFHRSFALPLECKAEGIATTYRDGILEICLPKRDEAKRNSFRVTVQG